MARWDGEWTKGLHTKADKESRLRELQGYKEGAFRELDTILESLLKKPANRNYSEAGWANQQIATNEWNAAIDRVRTLINPKE